MQFVILRILTQSELGWFGEFRRQGRETSRQRGINFDTNVVERVFPTAKATDEILLRLKYRGDKGKIKQRLNPLRRQAKNWRLVGDKVEDIRFGNVNPGDLWLMTINAIGDIPECTFDIIDANSPTSRSILALSETSRLGLGGMIALHSNEVISILTLLKKYDNSLFKLSEDLEMQDSNYSNPIDFKPISGEDLKQPPNASRMIDIVSSIGHDLNVAVADLIDNSINAGATQINISFPDPGESGRILAVADNGHGMSPRELLQAMRFGSDRDYNERDLGRFGIGLKAASLSQARVLIVASRRSDTEPVVFSWDKREVKRSGDWNLIQPTLDDNRKSLILEPLIHQSGTVVFWDDMTPPKAPTGIRRRNASNDNTPFGVELESLSRYLGMVFNRFISGKARGHTAITITLNNSLIKPWDPFISWHCDTQQLPGTVIKVAGADSVGCPVEVKPVIVPAHDEYTTEEERNIAGFWGNWQDMQGFYFFRNDRIIQAGGWCGLWITDPHYQLLRVAVDLESVLDEAFGIDVSKMNVQPPAIFMKEAVELLKPIRTQAKHHYTPKKRNVRKASQRSGKMPNNSKREKYAHSPFVSESDKTLSEEVDFTQPNIKSSDDKSIKKHKISISTNCVNLNGKGWRIRTDIAGNRIIEFDHSIPSCVALYDAIHSHDQACAAIYRIISAVENEPTLCDVLKRALIGEDEQ